MKTFKLFFLVAGIFLFSCTNDADLLPEQNALYHTTTLKGGIEKVDVCHFDSDTGESKTISIAPRAVDAHLAHGDYLGECNTSVLYDFDSCTFEDLLQFEGDSKITPNGLTGCGVELNGIPARVETPVKFGYGTYEMNAKALSGVSNQYMRLFGDESRNWESSAVQLGFRIDRTDDEGLNCTVNGTQYSEIFYGDMPVSYPNWYHVKFEITPEYFKLWLDETLMIEEYNYGGIPEPQGYWGIATYKQSAFDNLKYTPM